MKPNKVYGRCC